MVKRMEPIASWCNSQISIGSVSGRMSMNVWCEINRNTIHDRHAACLSISVGRHTHVIKRLRWDDDGFIYEE